MSGLLIFLFLFQVAASALQTTQSEVDYIARNLQIRYEVVTNYYPRSVRLTLANSGTRNIPAGNWEIYFTHIRVIPGTRTDTDGVVIGDFRFSHVNGVQYKMAPMTNFTGIPAKTETVLQFNPGGNIVSRTDLMPDWYVVAPNTAPRTILSTVGESLSYVQPFDTPEKWKRYPTDQYNPYTPEKRYNLYHVDDPGRALKRVIPTPVWHNLDHQSGSVHLKSGDWVIVAAENLDNETRFIKGETEMPVVRTAPEGRYIELMLNDTLDNLTSSEGYWLEVDPAKPKISIRAISNAGVFYGIQTLKGLLADGPILPAGRILDYPRFPWRGLHYDDSRNFHGQQHMFRLLDAMAAYKLNRLHWHLCDDEGWRLQIRALPELTEIGGRRCHNADEEHCVLPQLGSGPSTATSGSGFFTAAEYQEILIYANQLHIKVVPEFDMPGHGHAAIVAMKARFNKLKAKNATDAGKFNLHDEGDTSRYHSVQGFTDNAINPCIDSTYTFVDTLVREVKSLHEDIQPLEIFHFGGDEVAHAAWTNSSACIALRKELNITTNINSKLKEYFVRRVSNITNTTGLDLGGWEDGYLGGREDPYNITNLYNDNVYVHAWENIWENNKGKRAYVLANAGYKVVISHATHMYFDMPYEPDPEERGYYWATRFTDEKEVFGYMPDSVYDNIEWAVNGSRITKEAVCGKDNVNCPPLKRRENVLGIQGQLWSETVRTPEQFQYMVFPRLLALAERAWHEAPWERLSDRAARMAARERDWREFASSLGYRELRRLDSMGISYRVPVPGVRLHNGKLEAISAYPGLTLQYSTNEGRSWTDYSGSFEPLPNTKYTFITRSAARSRMSRSVSVVTPTPPPTRAASARQSPITATILVLCLLSLSLHNLINV